MEEKKTMEELWMKRRVRNLKRIGKSNTYYKGK